MSKKIITFIFVVIILLVGVGVWLAFTGSPILNNIFTSDEENLFPFGEQNNDTTVVGDTNTTDMDTDGDSTSLDTTPSPMRLIYDGPVAGAIAFDTKNDTIIRFIDRVKGNIFETYASTTKMVRLSNTTIPRVHDAYWFSSGETVVLRYIRDDNETISTFVGSLEKQSTTTITESEFTPYRLSGGFLPENIETLTLSPDQTSIFYILRNENGSTGYTISERGGTGKKVFTSPLRGWNATFPLKNNVLLETKPSYISTNSLHILNLTNGRLSELMSSVFGLTGLLSPDGKVLLASKSENSRITLFAKDVKTKKETVLNVATLPEKCVWSKIQTSVVYCGAPTRLARTNYPDVWYQGTLSFSDDIFRINVETGSVELVASPTRDVETEIDVIKPFLNKRESHLYFFNKNDYAFWSVALETNE